MKTILFFFVTLLLHVCSAVILSIFYLKTRYSSFFFYHVLKITFCFVFSSVKCHAGYYWCNKKRQCINAPRCDSVNDCGDYTDESLCGLPGQGINNIWVKKNSTFNILKDIFKVVNRNVLIKTNQMFILLEFHCHTI